MKWEWYTLPYDGLAKIFRAMAHPTRAQILDLLLDGERCVCEIISALELEQSNVSQHLGVLRGEQLVRSRKEGSQVIYALTCPCIGDLISAAKRVLAEKPSLRHG